MTAIERFRASWKSCGSTRDEDLIAMGPAVLELDVRLTMLESICHEHVIDGASSAAIKGAKIEVLIELQRRWTSPEPGDMPTLCTKMIGELEAK